MSTYQLAVLLHMASAFSMIAGVVLARVVKGMMSRTRDTRSLGTLLATYKRVPPLAMGGAVGALVTGTWLVYMQGYGFSTPWIAAAYVMLLFNGAVISRVIGPSYAAAEVVYDKAMKAGEAESAELHAALTQQKVNIASLVVDVNAFLIVAIMILKPWS